MNGQRATFSKSERLCSKKSIEQLFASQERLFVFPFRIALNLMEITEHREDNPAPVQVLISVGKRTFKKAVDRNRIKRLVREAYRLNKTILSSTFPDHSSQMPKKMVHIGFLYSSKKAEDWETIQSQMKKALLEIGQYLKKFNHSTTS